MSPVPFLPLLKFPYLVQKIIIEELDHFDRIMLFFLSARVRNLLKLVKPITSGVQCHVSRTRMQMNSKTDNSYRELVFSLSSSQTKVFKKQKTVFSIDGKQAFLSLVNEKTCSSSYIRQNLHIGFLTDLPNFLWLPHFILDVFHFNDINWTLDLDHYNDEELQMVFKSPVIQNSHLKVDFSRGAERFYWLLDRMNPRELELICSTPLSFEHPKTLSIPKVSYTDGKWVRIEDLLWRLNCHTVILESSLLTDLHLNLFLRCWLKTGNEKLRKMKVTMKRQETIIFATLFRGIVFVNGEERLTFLIATREDQGREFEFATVTVRELPAKLEVEIQTNRTEDFPRETRAIRILYKVKDVEKEILNQEARMELWKIEDDSEEKIRKLEELRQEIANLRGTLNRLNGERLNA